MTDTNARTPNPLQASLPFMGPSETGCIRRTQRSADCEQRCVFGGRERAKTQDTE